MKFNFRKITSVLACTAMLGSTLGFAAAATYPAPFVSGGAADAAIVYGSSSADSDRVAALDIGTSLSASVTSTGISATPTGEVKSISTSGQKLYIKDYLNTTKAALTSTDLPTILANGKVIDTDGTTYDYTQTITVPNTYVTYGKTVDNLATPVLNVYFETSSQNYSETITFPTAVNITKLENKDITLFGKKYTFSGSDAEMTTSVISLYENSQAQLIKSGESATITVGGTKYDIAVTSVESDTKSTITVNGVSQTVTEGSSYKVAGLDLYIKNVIGPNVAGEPRAVELYAGSAKLKLQNANNVIKGSSTLYGVTASITSPSTSLVSAISVGVTPYSLTQRTRYLKVGDSLTDPVFGTFSLGFASVTPGLDDASKDVIAIQADGEQKAKLKFTNKAGKLYDIDLFKPSALGLNATLISNASSDIYNSSGMGFDTYHVMVNVTSTMNENDYVITRNNEYSQIWQVTRIDVPNARVTFRDMGSGSSDQTVSLTGGAIASTGSLSLTDGSFATVTLFGNTTGNNLNVTVNKADHVLYTKGGAKIDLGRVAYPAAYNSTYEAGKIVVTEETSYNTGAFTDNAGGTPGQNPINVTLLYIRVGRTGYDMFVNSVVAGDSNSVYNAANLVNGDGTGIAVGDYDTYYLTRYGTFVKSSGQNDKIVTMYYNAEPTSLGVYIGGNSALSPSGSTIMTVKDSEVASVPGKNLVVVGGSCINTLAATLLGSSTPLCGADFTANTGISSGEYLIQTFSYGGKLATLVAGYDATDTTNAGKSLQANKPEIADGKKFKGITASSALTAI